MMRFEIVRYSAVREKKSGESPLAAQAASAFLEASALLPKNGAPREAVEAPLAISVFDS